MNNPFFTTFVNLFKLSQKYLHKNIQTLILQISPKLSLFRIYSDDEPDDEFFCASDGRWCVYGQMRSGGRHFVSWLGLRRGAGKVDEEPAPNYFMTNLLKNCFFFSAILIIQSSDLLFFWRSAQTLTLRFLYKIRNLRI